MRNSLFKTAATSLAAAPTLSTVALATPASAAGAWRGGSDAHGLARRGRLAWRRIGVSRLWPRGWGPSRSGARGSLLYYLGGPEYATRIMAATALVQLTDMRPVTATRRAAISGAQIFRDDLAVRPRPVILAPRKTGASIGGVAMKMFIAGAITLAVSAGGPASAAAGLPHYATSMPMCLSKSSPILDPHYGYDDRRCLQPMTEGRAAFGERSLQAKGTALSYATSLAGCLSEKSPILDNHYGYDDRACNSWVAQ